MSVSTNNIVVVEQESEPIFDEEILIEDPPGNIIFSQIKILAKMLFDEILNYYPNIFIS